MSDDKVYKIVIHMANEDYTLSHTIVYPRVEGLDVEYVKESLPYQAYESVNATRIIPSLENVIYSFKPLLNAEGQYCKVYDNKLATPNLDDFLGTFPKAERILMAKKYAEENEQRLESFIKEFGADQLREYLNIRFPEDHG